MPPSQQECTKEISVIPGRALKHEIKKTIKLHNQNNCVFVSWFTLFFSERFDNEKLKTPSAHQIKGYLILNLFFSKEALCNNLQQFQCINHFFIGHMWADWWAKTPSSSVSMAAGLWISLWRMWLHALSSLASKLFVMSQIMLVGVSPASFDSEAETFNCRKEEKLQFWLEGRDSKCYIKAVSYLWMCLCWKWKKWMWKRSRIAKDLLLIREDQWGEERHSNHENDPWCTSGTDWPPSSWCPITRRRTK